MNSLDYTVLAFLAITYLAGTCGAVQVMLGFRPWWTARFRVCLSGPDGEWWVSPTRTRHFAFGTSRAECSALTFRWYRLADVGAWLAFHFGPGAIPNLKLKWL